MTDMNEMAKVVRAYPFHDYSLIFPADVALISDYYANVFEKTFGQKKRSFFSSDDNGSVTGVVSVRSLDWDSEFFGISMASLGDFCLLGNCGESGQSLLKRAVRFAADQGVRHLSAKVNTKDLFTIHLLESEGFRYMDSILYYLTDLNVERKKGELKKRAEIEPLKPGQEQEALKIAERAFSEYRGRFKDDSCVPAHEASGFYVKWLDTSIKDSKQDVFAAVSDNALSGFAVWKSDTLLKSCTGKGVVTLALIGVSPDKTGTGIAGELINYASFFYDEADYFLIPVHVNNIGMRRSAVRSGARLASSRNTFHLSLG